MQIAVALLEKLQKRYLLKYVVVRNASLSPNAMVEEKEISKMKFQVLAERLFKLKWVTADETDDTKLQYEEFEKKIEKFATFSKSTDDLDLFPGKFLHKNQKYISFWRVCGNIFVFSHSQSTIERGFSVNKQLLVENLQEKSFYLNKLYMTT